MHLEHQINTIASVTGSIVEMRRKSVISIRLREEESFFYVYMITHYFLKVSITFWRMIFLTYICSCKLVDFSGSILFLAKVTSLNLIISAFTISPINSECTCLCNSYFTVCIFICTNQLLQNKRTYFIAKKNLAVHFGQCIKYFSHLGL